MSRSASITVLVVSSPGREIGHAQGLAAGPRPAGSGRGRPRAHAPGRRRSGRTRRVRGKSARDPDRIPCVCREVDRIRSLRTDTRAVVGPAARPALDVGSSAARRAARTYNSAAGGLTCGAATLMLTMNGTNVPVLSLEEVVVPVQREVGRTRCPAPRRRRGPRSPGLPDAASVRCVRAGGDRASAQQRAGRRPRRPQARPRRTAVLRACHVKESMILQGCGGPYSIADDVSATDPNAWRAHHAVIPALWRGPASQPSGRWRVISSPLLWRACRDSLT